MEGKFEAEKLEHVQGQEGQVDNPEKAQLMAGTEEIDRRWADRYEEYSRDSEAYKRKYRGVAFAASDRVFQGFDNLRELGVPPEYMRKQAEIEAEGRGALYDYIQEAREKSVGALDADVLVFWVQEISARVKRWRHARGARAGAEGALFLKEYAGSPEYQKAAVAERLAEAKRAAASAELLRHGFAPIVKAPDVILPKIDR